MTKFSADSEMASASRTSERNGTAGAPLNSGRHHKRQNTGTNIRPTAIAPCPSGSANQAGPSTIKLMGAHTVGVPAETVSHENAVTTVTAMRLRASAFMGLTTKASGGEAVRLGQRVMCFILRLRAIVTRHV